MRSSRYSCAKDPGKLAGGGWGWVVPYEFWCDFVEKWIDNHRRSASAGVLRGHRREPLIGGLYAVELLLNCHTVVAAACVFCLSQKKKKSVPCLLPMRCITRLRDGVLWVNSVCGGRALVTCSSGVALVVFLFRFFSFYYESVRMACRGSGPRVRLCVMVWQPRVGCGQVGGLKV